MVRIGQFDKLEPMVERAGFTIDEILTAPTGPVDREVERNVGRAFKGW